MLAVMVTERGAEAFGCCRVGVPGEGDSGRWKEGQSAVRVALGHKKVPGGGYGWVEGIGP